MYKKKAAVIFQRLVTLAALIAFIYAGSKLTIILYGYYDNWRNLSEVQDIYNEVLQEEDEIEAGRIRQQFDPLLKLNEDIVGWITVEDTRIDYPILQADNNSYYLTRNYKRNETRAGSIFMDYRNEVEAEANKNIILYGHRMKDGSMFGQLKKYLNESFFYEHRNIYYDTLYAGYDLEVFSVYQTTTDFYYIETNFPTDQSFGGFIESLQDKSLHKADVNITEGDRIVTLSTCDYSLDSNEGRLVVHAKLVKRGEAS
ncbi:class B sortase [Cytobacillus purgationiresistens]|uniref:Sortase B n=1 Tax=Cytobacillus purgationiresistens TaxID=863449 RepID=A0ABU0AMP7_9BACI|nr:class B sortase [Cytobacillus purgationiresistens]MDQ0272528.1 sortase B [Cytobacillus purgationiresistens]